MSLNKDALSFFLDTGTPKDTQKPDVELLNHQEYHADHERTKKIIANEPKNDQIIPIMDIKNNIIVLNNSLIKLMYYNQNEVDHCPRKIYMEMIMKQWTKHTTEAQANGLFFECLCIGQSADGTVILDLPRKKNGAKTVDQIRIEEQALIFNKLYPQYHMIILKEGKNKNVQVKFCTKWEDPKYKTYENFTVYLVGTIDIVSPIAFGNYNYPMCIIDLKLTQNRNSTYGAFAWGNASEMDHGQAYMYSYATGLPFVYWIWDYQPNDEERGNKFIPVKTQLTGIDDDEVRTKYSEFHETIRKCIQKLIEYDMEQWPCRASYNNCKGCFDNPKNNGSCQFANLIQEVS